MGGPESVGIQRKGATTDDTADMATTFATCSTHIIVRSMLIIHLDVRKIVRPGSPSANVQKGTAWQRFPAK